MAPAQGWRKDGSTGAIAPVDFEDFHKLSVGRKILKIEQDLTELVANVCNKGAIMIENSR